ncbi:hypothetical protein HMPREF9151_01425 [Hoylesella saccharolytica F0055]|uniref:Uncharacterized protein n=1 Tax=Hoylesella saccharolytica F0055 TaxID=1127699 RepID=L1N9S6_9BACT|nr:hypothetical protein HMPREF9151_01425 [Hoylesella saccharolytica F0055]
MLLEAKTSSFTLQNLCFYISKHHLLGGKTSSFVCPKLCFCNPKSMVLERLEGTNNKKNIVISM